MEFEFTHKVLNKIRTQYCNMLAKEIYNYVNSKE